MTRTTKAKQGTGRKGAKRSTSGERGKIGNDAVKAATGKTWPVWFSALDKAGCKDQDHKMIVAATAKVAPGTGGWWCQMVAVEYERERGLRRMNEKTDGFALSVSRTLPVPISRLYKAWTDTRTRRRWLADPDYTLRKSTRNKSLRITWVDGKTNLNVYFWNKGAAKSQVSVNHDKIADKRDVQRLKSYWAESLDALKALMAG